MGGPRQPPLRSLDSPTAVAYLAGMIDGEGTVGIYEARSTRSLRISHYVQVTVVNTDLALMDWLTATFGGRVDRRRDPSRNPTHKQPYAWRVHGPNAAALLEAVEPYMVIKSEQVAVARQLLALRRPGPLTDDDVAERAALKTRMHELNRRGNPADA